MDLQSYEQLVKSESTAKKYVLGFCWKNHQRFCPRCTSRRLYSSQWLRLVKLFELEVSTRKAATQLGLTYKTVYKAIATLRLAILAHAPDGGQFLSGQFLSGEIELDEAYFGGRRKGKRGRGAAGKVPVFGILERDGQVSVSVVPNVRAETLLDLTVKKVRRGSVVYTDKYQVYDALMFCGYRHLKIDHGAHFAQGRVSINGLEGFWSYAKERLAKHHGVSPQRFPLYLKELEFRYNHRQEDIFPRLVQYLCDFVPNLT